MYEYYIRDCYTGEEMCIEGYDFEEACDAYGIDPFSVEVLWDEYIG